MMEPHNSGCLSLFGSRIQQRLLYSQSLFTAAALQKGDANHLRLLLSLSI
jgi:hypothetical protein